MLVSRVEVLLCICSSFSLVSSFSIQHPNVAKFENTQDGSNVFLVNCSKHLALV